MARVSTKKLKLFPSSARTGGFDLPRPAHPMQSSRSFFTNTDKIKREDPYAQLGLQWGDGSTLSDIKAAYRRRATQLHPDINPSRQAQQDFQRLQRAYEVLTKLHTPKYASDALDGGSNSVFDDFETVWRFRVWRRSDDIATERTDVAGAAKERPIPPAVTRHQFAGAQLGHPRGGGRRAGEFLGTETRMTSSVGRGRSKWVQPKAFVPWNGGKGSASVADGRITDEIDHEKQ